MQKLSVEKNTSIT